MKKKAAKRRGRPPKQEDPLKVMAIRVTDLQKRKIRAFGMAKLRKLIDELPDPKPKGNQA